MFIRILKEEPNELRIEIDGEGHTFCNALHKVLLEDDNIELAGYDLPHLLTSSPIVYVRTKGQQKPEKALRDAGERLRSRSDEFIQAFEEALKTFDEERAR